METGEGIEVFETDIDLYLRLFCEENNIEDMRKESQSIWNSCLYYIYKHVFKNSDDLKCKNNIPKADNNGIMDSTCNRYDIDKCIDILYIYIYDLCMKYDKVISIIGYTTLTGIPRSTLYEWGNDNRVLSSKGKDIYKNLRDFREESLLDKLVSGNRNPLGIITMLNHEFEYAGNGPGQQIGKMKTLAASDLPRLSCAKHTNNSEQDIVEDDS